MHYETFDNYFVISPKLLAVSHCHYAGDDGVVGGGAFIFLHLVLIPLVRVLLFLAALTQDTVRRTLRAHYVALHARFSCTRRGTMHTKYLSISMRGTRYVQALRRKKQKKTNKHTALLPHGKLFTYLVTQSTRGLLTCILYCFTGS